MESIEKLRKFGLDVCWRIGGWPKHTEDMANEIADEIEREIAERYMKLPVDADGVPIHVGDKVWCKFNNDMREVGYVGKDGFHEKTHHYFDAENFTHVKPDPVKELLEELIERAYAIEKVDSAPHPVVDECDIDEIAARIREAVEK